MADNQNYSHISITCIRLHRQCIYCLHCSLLVSATEYTLCCLTLQLPKEWYYYPHGYNASEDRAVTQAASSPSAQPSSTGNTDHEQNPDMQALHAVNDPSVDACGRAGPLTKDQIKHMHSKQQIAWDTHFWAPGLPCPLPLWEIRELRWMLMRGVGVLTAFESAHVALQILLQMASLQPAVDEAGQTLQPLPRVHRVLAEPRCLPHVSQVMLTGVYWGLMEAPVAAEFLSKFCHNGILSGIQAVIVLILCY